MKLEEIKLDKTEESRKDAILENINKEVILRENPLKWSRGTLLDEYNCREYSLKTLEGNKKRLYYQNLEQIFIVE